MPAITLENGSSSNGLNGNSNGDVYGRLSTPPMVPRSTMSPVTNGSPGDFSNAFPHRGLKTKTSRYFNRRLNGDAIHHPHGHFNGHSNGVLDGYDIEAIRENFPGLEANTIALNNAGGSLVYKGVIES